LLKLLAASRDHTPREQLRFVVSQLLADGQEAKDDLTLVRLTVSAG